VNERDWIDDVKAERDAGIHRPLNQSQHEAVNARYPDTTIERCCVCDEPTGRAGRGDDSLYAEDGSGPYCEPCWLKLPENGVVRP
jgi:hypothetical protein